MSDFEGRHDRLAVAQRIIAGMPAEMRERFYIDVCADCAEHQRTLHDCLWQTEPHECASESYHIVLAQYRAKHPEINEQDGE